jgi:2-iminobutanoate/2-iminopropanoate deaminase
MSKQIIQTNQAPAAVGPYSQATVINGMVFTAGQVGLIPGTKSLAEGGVQAQARQALDNLKAVLEAAGTSLENVVKATVFLDNMDDFAAVNEVYATYFSENPPARSAVEVARLPLGALVEVEAIAVI